MLEKTAVRTKVSGNKGLFIEEKDDDFYKGYNAAWDEFSPGKPIGDPVASHDYRLGWWTGIRHTRIWHEGWDAYEKGIKFCPYVLSNDLDSCSRRAWLDGYWAAMT